MGRISSGKIRHAPLAGRISARSNANAYGALPIAIAFLLSGAQAYGQAADRRSPVRLASPAMAESAAGKHGEDRTSSFAGSGKLTRLMPSEGRGARSEMAPSPHKSPNAGHALSLKEGDAAATRSPSGLPREDDYRLHQEASVDFAIRNERVPLLGGWAKFDDDVRYKFRGPVLVVQRAF